MKNKKSGLKPYLSPLGVWALSFGCSVGWGSFVMPGTTFLPIAGPIGTALGIAIGAIVMLIIGRNYFYLMNRYPDSGGIVSYTKNTLGYDHSFLSGWFAVLTYVVIIWANLTALALIARRLLGGMFQFGLHYRLAEYDIYLGEIVLAIGVLVICAFFCIIRKRVAMWVQILMALVLFLGIVACFVFVSAKNGTDYQPAFSESSDSSVIVQIMSIIALAPWAYVGFESISHSTEEFNFKRKKAFFIILISLFTAGLAYLLLSLLAASAQPEGYSGWPAYVADLDNISGLNGLPTFFATNQAMGDTGRIVLGVTLVGGIVTGIIGNTVAASRVLYTMAKENILPKWFGKLNKDSSPQNAILFIMAISVIIPFFGRTAISWIIDVTTVGGTIIYFYASAAAFKESRSRKNRTGTVFGLLGIIISVGFALYFLIPNISSVSTLATESYLILTIWSVLGLVFFRAVFGKDQSRRFGKSFVVWVVLLFLIMFTSIIWMEQANNKAINDAKVNIVTRYDENMDQYPVSENESKEVGTYVSDQMLTLDHTLTRNNFIRLALIAAAIFILFTVYSLMNKRQRGYDKIHFMAFKDAMTGVGNKHAYEQMQGELNAKIEAGTAEAFALAVCDINGLKRVNDTMGHNAGDDYIKDACLIICDTFSHSPVYRIGGDEFVVLLRNRDYDNREVLEAHLTAKNNDNHGTGRAIIASGISDYRPGEDENISDVFTRADQEMYKNKKALKRSKK